MNKQITLAAFSDGLANVRTKKKEFLAQTAPRMYGQHKKDP